MLHNKCVNVLASLTLPPGLTGLTYLSLGFNHLSDFSFLSGLTNLATLELGNSELTSLALPAGLTSLTTLYLGGNPLSDFSFVSPASKVRLVS